MRPLIITFVRHAEEIRPFKTRESILAIRVSQISVHDTSNHLGSARSVIADHLGVSLRAVCVYVRRLRPNAVSIFRRCAKNSAQTNAKECAREISRKDGERREKVAKRVMRRRNNKITNRRTKILETLDKSRWLWLLNQF